MKRKINESMETAIKIDVVNLSNEYPEISIDEMADYLEKFTNAKITQQEENGTVIMSVDGLTTEELIDEITSFICNDDNTEELDYQDVQYSVEDSILESEEISEIEEGMVYSDYDDYDLENDDLDDDEADDQGQDCREQAGNRDFADFERADGLEEGFLCFGRDGGRADFFRQ